MSQAAVMKGCALSVLGPTPPSAMFPWLRGREQELRQLRAEVRNAEIQLIEARKSNNGEVPPLLEKRRLASKALLTSKRRWEAPSWGDLAEKAQTASAQRDEFTFWQICKQLCFREQQTLHRSAKRAVSDPVFDREAWKSFLSSVQAGIGKVDPEVWDHVPVAPAVASEFSLIPTCEKFLKALKSMRCGKRGGHDDVTVELIKFGGLDIQRAVFHIIVNMWQGALLSKPGEEAATWSPSTILGICISVF